MTHSLVALTLISFLILAPVMLFSVVGFAAEPDLPSILDNLGFTNVDFTDTETFSPATYNVTLYAEFASYNNQNVLSYYPINTSDFQTIFTGPEGATGDLGGYVTPPIFRYFTADTQFGLSMLAPEHRYFTQHELNEDYPEIHAQVYVNLDSPNMFLIGFENYFGGFDRDYNDIVFSIVPVAPPEIISVIRSPVTPNYDQSVKISAHVIKGDADLASVILSYQVNSGIWNNVTMNLESGLYVADISDYPYNTAVNYKVYASDTIGISVVSGLFSYVVGDFVPPVISNVLYVPDSPIPLESVKVTAEVTEPAIASGVRNVNLRYSVNGNWTSIPMSLEGGLWTANISGQSGGTYVEFFVQAFDNAGNNAKSSTFDYTVLDINLPPIAEFIASPTTVYTDEDVDFDASASYDPDGTIVSYSWDFGDGNTGSGVTTIHSYADDGVYSVTLTVTDNDGAVGTKTESITVLNRPPVADIVASATNVDKQQTVTFDANGSYDPDGYIVSYSWDFGDGSTATGVLGAHAYDDHGVYTVTLTVTDNDGATDTATVAITVRNKPPVAVFTESAHTVNKDETINFNAAGSYDPDGTIVSYSWNFGDGTTATGVSVSHAYDDDGSYQVTLTVTDNDGATDSTSATKTVVNLPPVAEFTESAHTVDTSETIYFDASASYDPDGTIVSYSWDFGDGSTATGVTVDHAYDDDGVYTVTLTVTDDDGATGSVTDTKTVLNRPPIASFTESAHNVSTSETIYFDASGSYDPDGTIVSYSWDFGDGNTATGVTTDHAYSVDGNYTVTLTVTDNDGASASATDEKIVKTETVTTLSLAVLSVIGLGITALTVTLLYGLFILGKRRKKKNKENT